MNRLKLNKALRRFLNSVVPSSVFAEIEAGKARVLKVTNSLVAVVRFELNQMVVIAIKGKGLYSARQKFIDYARANGKGSIRFHTRHPKRLAKGTAGLPLQLKEVRRRLLGRDEYVYVLQVL